MRLLGIVCLVFFVLGVTTPFAPVASQHACAPPIPPSVPGTPIPPPATPGLLFINEVLLAPHSAWNCSTSDTSYAWVEIYNPQDQPFDLYAVHANLDGGPGTNAFYLPFGAAIAPHGYLVVFPYTNSSFRLTETSTLRLIIDTTAIDQVTIPSLGADMSYARMPDGGATWQTTSTPTIDTSNEQTQATPTPKSLRGNSNNRQHGGGGHNRNTAIGRNDNQKIIVDGVQPQWSKIQLPTNTPSPAITTNNNTAISPTPASNSMNIPGKILWTVAAIALALLGCRWLLMRL